MRLLVDGNVYTWQRTGGVSNYFNELLPRLSRFPNTVVHLLVPPNVSERFPRRGRVVVERPFPPSLATWPSARLDTWVAPWRGVIEQHLWRVRLWTARDVVFHSSFFTRFPRPGTPHVVTVYDMIHELFPELFTTAYDEAVRVRKRICISQATRIIAISQQTKDDVCRIYNVPPDKVDVIYLGVSDHFGRQLADAASAPRVAEPYLLYVGDRTHYKNFPALVRAFAHSPLQGSHTLAVVGAPASVEEQQFFQSLGVESRVQMIPFPSDETLRMLYRQAAVFVYPSLYEGFGLPLLEAMACGAPVAAARAGSIPEVAGDAASYFDPRDPVEIAAAIERLLDPKTANEFRERGLVRVRSFSWDRAAVQTMHVYRQALAGAS